MENDKLVGPNADFLLKGHRFAFSRGLLLPGYGGSHVPWAKPGPQLGKISRAFIFVTQPRGRVGGWEGNCFGKECWGVFMCAMSQGRRSTEPSSLPLPVGVVLTSLRAEGGGSPTVFGKFGKFS